jgi:hypothetical protein
MTTHTRYRFGAVVLIAALVLSAAALVGCSKKEPAKPAVSAGATVLDGLAKAQSALSTTAPDAKLLVVQTAQASPTTATPDWIYLFGSPKTGRTYAVYVANGKSMGAQEYGSAGLTDAEWAKVPKTGPWTVDSDDALKKALVASGAKGTPNAYVMGLMTFKPSTDTSTIEPYVWNVQFDPGSSGAATGTISVDAKTGAATVAK